MDTDRVDRIIDKHGGDASALIQVLLDIQKECRWLPPEALERVEEKLGVPMSAIRRVATFYKAFSLVPKGRHGIRVCTGTSCHVRGAGRVLSAVREAAGIVPGETDPDGRYSLETVNCLGCCAAGPVMVVDGHMHASLSPSDAAETLKGYG